MSHELHHINDNATLHYSQSITFPNTSVSLAEPDHRGGMRKPDAFDSSAAANSLGVAKTQTRSNSSHDNRVCSTAQNSTAHNADTSPSSRASSTSHKEITTIDVGGSDQSGPFCAVDRDGTIRLSSRCHCYCRCPRRSSSCSSLLLAPSGHALGCLCVQALQIVLAPPHGSFLLANQLLALGLVVYIEVLKVLVAFFLWELKIET